MASATSPRDLSLNRFMRVGYGYAFLFDFCLAYAIYTALFSLEGLGVDQIGILLAFWSVTAVILELPSGALSDWLDRRLLLVIAPLFKALTFGVWAFADGNFWLYGLGFLFWSIGQALYSGTFEALLYERLASAGREDDFAAIYGRASAAESVGIAAGLLLGGLVAASGFGLAVWLSVPPMIAASLCAMGLADVRRARAQVDESSEPGYFENFAIAFAQLRASPALLRVLIYISVGLLVLEVIEEFDQLFYLAVSLPLWLFGLAGAVGLAAAALGSIHAHRLARHRWLAWALPGLAGLLLIVSSAADGPVFVVVLEAAYIVIVPASVLANARFQHLLDGRSRATATSALEVAQNIVGIAVTLGFGFAAEHVGILPAYGWAGVAMLAISAWALWQHRAGVALLD